MILTRTIRSEIDQMLLLLHLDDVWELDDARLVDYQVLRRQLFSTFPGPFLFVEVGLDVADRAGLHVIWIIDGILLLPLVGG